MRVCISRSAEAVREHHNGPFLGFRRRFEDIGVGVDGDGDVVEKLRKDAGNLISMAVR